MKKLSFRYETEYQFSLPVSKHFYTLKIVPETTKRQVIKVDCLEIAKSSSQTRSRDVYGNEMIMGSILEPHDKFSFLIEGTAQVNQAVFEEDEGFLSAYRYPTELTKPTKALEQWFQQLLERTGFRQWEPGEQADYLYHQVYDYMEYVPGVTTVETTAGQVFQKGQGVCQDYTHLLLCLLRMAGLPSRYIVGMMLGEGYSHAWAEVNINGVWVGIDPTNDKYVDDNYIKISQGRDYRDCIVCKGHFMGQVVQKQEIVVKVEEIT